MPCTRSKISHGKNLTFPKYKVRGTNLITVVRSAWNHNIFRIPSLLSQPHCYSLTGFQSHFWSQEQKKVCRIPAQCSAWPWPQGHLGTRPPCASMTCHKPSLQQDRCPVPCAQLWTDPPKLSLRMQTATFSLFSNLSHSNQRKHLPCPQGHSFACATPKTPTHTPVLTCFQSTYRSHSGKQCFKIIFKR